MTLYYVSYEIVFLEGWDTPFKSERGSVFMETNKPLTTNKEGQKFLDQLNEHIIKTTGHPKESIFKIFVPNINRM